MASNGITKTEIKDQVHSAVDAAKDKALEWTEEAKEKVGEIRAGAQDKMDGMKADFKAEVDKSGMPEDYQSLKSDLQNLRADFASLMSSLKDGARAKVGEAKDELKDTTAQVSHSLTDLMQHTRERGGEFSAQLETQVKDRPLMSVLVAFGAGLILSRMMERR